ncbi:hypothetical protein [Streptomyces sp. NPDC088847]|uniref:hypothetical protein n=1 Tax=Streptomyces sp. NPDC088847 TaxID=3365909 RepID=UPI003823CF47
MAGENGYSSDKELPSIPESAGIIAFKKIVKVAITFMARRPWVPALAGAAVGAATGALITGPFAPLGAIAGGIAGARAGYLAGTAADKFLNRNPPQGSFRSFDTNAMVSENRGIDLAQGFNAQTGLGEKPHSSHSFDARVEQRYENLLGEDSRQRDIRGQIITKDPHPGFPPIPQPGEGRYAERIAEYNPHPEGSADRDVYNELKEGQFARDGYVNLQDVNGADLARWGDREERSVQQREGKNLRYAPSFDSQKSSIRNDAVSVIQAGDRRAIASAARAKVENYEKFSAALNRPSTTRAARSLPQVPQVPKRARF